jgi:hypothetical protein
MKRLLDTYPSRVLLEFTPTRTLVISVFDAHGWQTKESLGDWDHDWDPDDIGDALVRAAGVQRDEADRIQRQVLQELDERGEWAVAGDHEEPSKLNRVLAWSVIAFLFGAALIGIGTIAVFIWNTFPVGAIIFGAVLAYAIFLLFKSGHVS